jgi:hypothetical protein
VASIERTAYPRFRHEPSARELRDLFTPTQEEVQFGQTLVRSDEHSFAAVVLLKCLQYLGYFPELGEIPGSIVNHIRVMAPVYDQTRTIRRHQTAIREFLQLKRRHSREARKIAVRTVLESARVMDNPADLINVANNCAFSNVSAEFCHAASHGEPGTQRGPPAHVERWGSTEPKTGLRNSTVCN